MALTAAPVERRSWHSADGAILPEPTVHRTGSTPANPSQFLDKIQSLQRLAYFAVPLAGFLAVATGWAIHKPAQLSWLTAVFGGFDQARVWHFWLMVFLVVFVIPHVVLVITDGWDTLRSMITGWSTRFKRSEASDHEL
jgi:thiosulfate reductase cytochrome b subunit